MEQKVANQSDRDPTRGPRSKDETSDAAAPTSGSREESMSEAGTHEFGAGSTAQDPDPDNQGDGTSEDREETPARDAGKQNPASSGTTSLGGEPKDAESIRSPGGIEGTG